jgi:hypothetical protein
MNPAVSSLPLVLLAACAHPGSHAGGTFDVKVTPIVDGEHPMFGRLSFDKTFHGDLAGESKGQMLAWGTGETSGAYVALERVEGTLGGRRGSFVLAHKGEMTAGVPDMLVTVAPGSGTDELTGLSGRMVIHIAAGKHSYDFEYALPAR